MRMEEKREEKQGFWARKNIVFSLERYFIDALGAMALGLFSSLIVGLILATLGEQLTKLMGEKAMLTFLINSGKTAQSMMGPAIGIAVAHGLQAPPLVLFASVITGAAGAAAGGPAGCFVAAVCGAAFGKAVSKETKVDIIVTPAVTILAGLLAAAAVGPGVNRLMLSLGQLVMRATELQPVPMGIIVSVVMGLVLTAPISSAALAIMMDLSGLAAGAATVGCSAQMIGFAVSSFRENGWGGLIAQGLGTSMLQVPNIVRNPWILLPPTLASAIVGPLATTVVKMYNNPAGAGMGTSGLVGQIGTFTVMGFTLPVLLKIILLHILLPALLSLCFSEWLRKSGRIKFGDYDLKL